jgi:hypothetical protein
MGRSTSSSAAAEDPGPRQPGGAGSRGTPAATDDVVVDAASYSYGRPSRGSWPSGAPPTGAPMAGVLGELAFCYGACWLHHRSAQRRGE